MPGIEQLADMHDSFVELLRTMDLRPLVERICMAVGIERERISAIRERSPAVAVMSFAHPARKTIGDIVLTVHDRNDRVLIVLIFEVQMSWDATKRWVWALLAVAFATRREARGSWPYSRRILSCGSGSGDVSGRRCRPRRSSSIRIKSS
jgi:hypothetical protein